MMNALLYECVGYAVVKNLDYLTAVPLFVRRGSKNSDLFRQHELDGIIVRFSRISVPTEDIQELPSQAPCWLRSLGDSAVYIELNLNSFPILAGNFGEFQEKLRAVLSEKDDSDPVVALELSRLTGDLKLEERHLRRFVRLLGYQSPTVRQSWLKSGLFSKGLLSVAESCLRDIKPFSPISEHLRTKNTFASVGFAAKDVGYFCSSSVLEASGLFGVDAARDPITIKMRPLIEFERQINRRPVVLFSLEDFYADGLDNVEKMLLDAYKQGASLVMVVSSNGLAEVFEVFSDNSILLEKLDSQADLCILRIDDQTLLRRFIRANHSAEWLEEQGYIFGLT